MDLNRVATFVRAVEAGSFGAAAALLRVPASSVSRSVAKLEHDLGVVLLERSTNGIVLTDAGRAYYDRARDALASLEIARAPEGAVRDARGVVRVAAPLAIAAKLATLLGAFTRDQPDVRVETITTGRGAELVGADVDLAIVEGPIGDSSLVVRKLGTSVQRLYAAQAYLDRREAPRSTSDLAHHDAVLHRGRGGRATWNLIGPSGPEIFEVRGRVSGDSLFFVLEAIASGHGIGLLPDPSRMLTGASAQLAAVLPSLASRGVVQSLVHAPRQLPKRVALLRDLLASELLLP